MKTAATATPNVAALLAAEQSENERAAFWALVPPPARVVVMLVARMPRDRAGDPLTAFTAMERRNIAIALSMIEGHLSIAARCMSDTQPAQAVLLH